MKRKEDNVTPLLIALIMSATVVTLAYAQQQMDVKMPDGTLLRGTVEKGVFTPLSKLSPVLDSSHPLMPSPVVQTPLTPATNLHLDQNVNSMQNISSNSRMISKQEYGAVDTITKLGGFFLNAISLIHH